MTFAPTATLGLVRKRQQSEIKKVLQSWGTKVLEQIESLGSFKKRLGMAGDEVSSGDITSWNKGSGSKLCRSELYLWIVCSIAPKTAKPTTKIGRKLGEFYDLRQAQLNNPDIWKEKTIAKEKNKLINELQGKVKKANASDSI